MKSKIPKIVRFSGWGFIQTACLSFTLINSAFIQSALQIINTYDVVGEGHINLVNMACSPFTAFVPIEALVFDL